jgi:hypothetical protein
MSHPVRPVPEGSEAPSANDRRAWVRYTRIRAARVRADTAPTRIFEVAVIRDLSVNGVSLILNSRVKPDTVMEIEPRGLGFRRPLLARVVRVAPQADGWLLGCQLLENLSEEELQKLLS